MDLWRCQLVEVPLLLPSVMMFVPLMFGSCSDRDWVHLSLLPTGQEPQPPRLVRFMMHIHNASCYINVCIKALLLKEAELTGMNSTRMHVCNTAGGLFILWEGVILIIGIFLDWWLTFNAHQSLWMKMVTTTTTVLVSQPLCMMWNKWHKAWTNCGPLKLFA